MVVKTNFVLVENLPTMRRLPMVLLTMRCPPMVLKGYTVLVKVKNYHSW